MLKIHCVWSESLVIPHKLELSSPSKSSVSPVLLGQNSSQLFFSGVSWIPDL